MKIRVAHSPDSDDAFMFYALEEGLLDTGDIEFEGILSDIETLNRKALNGEYDVTAISFHNYPYVARNYYLISCGGSVGYKYGPVVVAKKDMDLRGKRIGIPGERTTAYLVMRLYEPDFIPVFTNFDRITEATEKGVVDAGLIIHEGQLTYPDSSLVKIVDLGEWWYDQTKLPMPLGCNVVKKDLGLDTASKISKLLKESILYSLKHRKKALEYASRFGRGLDPEKVDKFVGMYVNNRTVEYGKDDITAIKLLLDRGYKEGIITVKPRLEMV